MMYGLYTDQQATLDQVRVSYSFFLVASFPSIIL